MALETQVDGRITAERHGSEEQTILRDATDDGEPLGTGFGAVAPIWLQRISLFVLVLFCVYLGVLVMVLPWWTRVWDNNTWIQSHPALAGVLHTGAVRGIISGLGLVDIWIGVSEAVHYREHRG